MTGRTILVIILVVGLAASAMVGVQRMRVESRNRAVELVIDYAELAQVSAASGKAAPAVLRKFRQVGVTGVAVTEQTLRDLVDSRLVSPYSEQQFAVSEKVASRVIAHLRAALGADRVKSTQVPGARYSYVTIHGDLPLSYIQGLPVGLPEEALSMIGNAGLEVVARLTNYPGVTPEAIDRTLSDVKSKGIRKVIFFGDQVLGFRGATEATAKSLEKNGLLFGRVEFARQKGEMDIAEHIPDRVVIVHSISQNEMPTLSAGAIAERFAKAAKERGVRLVYLRMMDTASSDLLRDNAAYILGISRAIREAGFALRDAHPMEEVQAPTYLRVIAGAGVGAGFVLLLLLVVEMSRFGLIAWTVAALLVCAGLSAAGAAGPKAVALIAALVFPTLAAINAVRRSPGSPTLAPGVLGRAVGRLALAAATAVAGGILIVGLLSSRMYMLRIDQFAGIKLAHVTPLLALSVLFAGRVVWKRDTWAAQKQRLAESLRRLGSDPVLMWQAAGIVAVMAVVGLVVARSGNDAGLQVSPMELKFRSILDRVMLVRPRTKEFLIGYPALILGIAFALRGRRSWAAPLVVVGSIGLVSALNTFCHIHTPLALSALRTLNGLIVGSVVGMIAYVALRNLPGRENKE